MKGLLGAADIGKLACQRKPEGCSFPLIACPPVRLGACTLAVLLRKTRCRHSEVQTQKPRP